jgi:hypothetical protein
MRIFGLKDIQFQQIFNKFESYLQNSIGPIFEVNKSTVFGQLMTVLASVYNNALLYIEDALTEQNKFTAQRKKSVYGLAAQSGYVPSYGRAAGVWVRFAHKANNNNTFDVIIPDKTKLVCSQNGMYYCLDLGKPVITIPCNQGLENSYLYAVQGHFESQTFTASGGNLYSINMTHTGYIDTNYLQVYVNGEKWDYADSLYDMLPMQKAFTYKYNPVQGIDIMFGNQRHGFPIMENDVIEVQYLLHDGEAGNLKYNPNDRFVFAMPLKNTAGEEVSGNEMFDICFAKRDAVAAGSNSEDIAQVRQMIGYNSRAMVLADSNNYKAFINRFSFCGYNRTWSEPGSMIVKSLIMKNYRLSMTQGKDYFNLTDSDFVLSDLQKASIKNAIIKSDLQLAGTIYDILDMDICKYAIYVYVKLKDDTFDKQIVTEKIKNTVGNFFGNIQSDSYIPKSDIITAIKNDVSEVDGVNIYFLSKRNEDAINSGHYIENNYIYDPTNGTYKNEQRTVWLLPGENPNLGLDAHGNILIHEDHEFPVLMGGWIWINDKLDEVVAQPITVIFE